MKLSKASKIALLVVTLLPLVYMALFLASIASTFFSGPRPSVVFEHFGVLMAVHVGVMFLMFALMTFYVVFLFRTDRVRGDMKAVWAVAIFMGSLVAMPIFWYLYIWPEDTSALHSVNRASFTTASNTLRIKVSQKFDGRWIAVLEELSGVAASGASRDEAIVRAQSQALRAIADRLERGQPAREVDGVFVISG